MKTWTVYLALFCSLSLYSQEKPAYDKSSVGKGVTPLSSPPSGNRDGGTIRAVVVGISDYQDPDIPDLRFADRDAEAFAGFLRSPAGGGLDDNHLRLLTNEKSTTGQLGAALDWLLEQSGEGDQAIIYFSGHGDVELKTRSQLGFLLTWDSPAHAYMAGAYPIFYLQTIIETLSLEKKARVVVITDACHAGKLAGQSLGGAGLTNANLARQFAREVKILSCQPNEYSLEGEQWGGGHGAFSYHLIDGLYGLADNNADGGVNLLEIGRYLEDHVSSETAPQSQVPMTVGNRNEQLAVVVPELLAHLRKFKSGQLPEFSPVGGRGLEDPVLAALSTGVQSDSSVRELYHRYKKALEDKAFLAPEGACADAYYVRLMQEPSLGSLYNSIRREYAAALQDDAQQFIQKLMAIDLQQLNKTYIEQIMQYRDFPHLLARAAELLGEGHYMYASLKARQYLFEGYLYYLETRYSEAPETGQRVLEKYRQSLQYQPDNPATYFYMSECFATKIKNQDSTYYYGTKATGYAETWVLPYAYLAYNLTMRFRKFDEAKKVLDEAIRLDSSNNYVLTALGAWHFYQKHYPEAIDAFQRLIRQDSTNYLTWFNLGTAYFQSGNMEAAEPAFLHSVRINPVQFNAAYALGLIYQKQNRLTEAETFYLQAIQAHPRNPKVRSLLATLYLDQNRSKEAEQQLLAIIDINPAETDAGVWFRLAGFATLDNRPEQALEFLEKAVRNGKPYEAIRQEPALEALHPLEAYKTLLKKYFPDQAGNE